MDNSIEGKERAGVTSTPSVNGYIERDEITIIILIVDSVHQWTKNVEIQKCIQIKKVQGVYLCTKLQQISEKQKQKMLYFCKGVPEDQYLTFINCEYCGDWDVASYMSICDYTDVSIFCHGPLTQISALCNECQ
jgi:hypothetical protein